MTDPYALAGAAAAALATATGVDRHDVAVVLGSGWGRCADALGSAEDVELAELPGFVTTTAGGHRATARSLEVGGRRVLVFLGRVHLYEGLDANAVAHGVRTAAAAGCRAVVLTNAAGSLRANWPIGQAVLLSDHVNLTGHSPLTGPPPPVPLPGRHVDLTDLYSARLRAIARAVDPALPEGVYLGLPGPHFETPAEIRMAATLGVDLVGMSTVLEAIAARHAGLEVLGISLATNLAAGVTDRPVSADEVVEAGDAAADDLGRLLDGVLAHGELA